MFYWNLPQRYITKISKSWLVFANKIKRLPYKSNLYFLKGICRCNDLSLGIFSGRSYKDYLYYDSRIVIQPGIGLLRYVPVWQVYADPTPESYCKFPDSMMTSIVDNLWFWKPLKDSPLERLLIFLSNTSQPYHTGDQLYIDRYFSPAIMWNADTCLQDASDAATAFGSGPAIDLQQNPR